MFKGEQFQPSARQSGRGVSHCAKNQVVMWSNCKIEKLHVIILQAECDDVKGRTNDGALSLLEAFPSGELKVTRSTAHWNFFSSFSLDTKCYSKPCMEGVNATRMFLNNFCDQSRRYKPGNNSP